MAILKIGSLDPHGAALIRREIVTDSVALTVSDSVKTVTGFISLGTAGVAVFGHVMQIGTDSGVGLNTTGVAGSEIGSYLGSFTMASDNETVAKVRAEIDVSQNTLYSAEVDATIGTTTGSDLLGYNMDLIDEDTLDENTAATTVAQYSTWGTDPADTTKAVVSINESSVFNVV